MPSRTKHFCNYPGCPELVSDTFCEEHTAQRAKQFDKARGSAAERGYTYRWQQYSKAFLRRPENQICKLHLPGCTILAQCVDHIIAPDGPKDTRFWDKANHQAACIRCNSVKGRRTIRGEFELGE